MTGKGKHFEINHIFVNYECHISEVGVKTLYSRTDFKSLCSDKENYYLVFGLTGFQTIICIQ